MHEIIKHCIARILKKQGFDSFEEKGIEFFIIVLELFMQKILSSIKDRSLHCSRNRTTLIDMTNNIIPFIFNDIDPLFYENETEKREELIYTPISAPVEKFMHIYEFMPDFPPLHTFKETIIKEKKIRSRARDVKDRIEQRNKIIDSLIELVRNTEKKDRIVNYLNQ